MITVVSGLPRSGTSMMMQMLQCGGLEPFTDEQRAPDESNPRGYFEHEEIKRLGRQSGDAETPPPWLDEAEESAVKVIAPLLKKLPAGGHTYRVIFMERALEEILASQQKMLQRLGTPAPERRIEALKQVFPRQLRQAEAWLEEQPHTEALHVPHRAVLEAPREQAERVHAFLHETTDAPLDPKAMAAAVDPALHRERAS